MGIFDTSIRTWRLAFFWLPSVCCLSHLASPQMLEAAEPPRLIWSDREMNTIRSALLDGTDPQLLISGLGEARGVDVDVASGMLYWADNGKNRIQRSRLDGTQTQDLITSGLGFPAGVAVDGTGGKLYWADANNSKLQRSNLDGSQVEDLITGLANPYFVTLDLSHQQIYWTDYGSRKIQRANLDGTQVVDLVTLSSPSLLRGIDLDLIDQKIYWTDRGTDLIQRSNLDGSQVETLYKIPPSGVDNAPHGITVDHKNGHIYWVDNGTVKLQRANLDGSQVVDILTKDSQLLARPWEILLIPGRDDPLPIPCDVDQNGICNAADMDTISSLVRSGTFRSSADLNGDTKVDEEDRVRWVEGEMKTYFGDSNLDGLFSTTDLVTVFQAGQYEDALPANSTWATGDWNGDGEFASNDLVLVFQHGGFEAGPRVAPVPEPPMMQQLAWFASLFLLSVARTSRRA